MKTQLKQLSVDLRNLLLLLIIVIGSAPAFADTDMTSSLTNPNFDNGKTGWNGSTFEVGGRSDNPCAETWNSQSFDVYQTLTGLPNGRYLVTCQGFYRAGGYAAAASSRNNSTEKQYGHLYANNEQVALRSILDVGKEGLNYADAGGGWDPSPQATVSYDGGSYKIPNNMHAASYAFSHGISLNKLEVNVTDGTLRIGIKKTGYIAEDWLIFDDFHLYRMDGASMLPTDINYYNNDGIIKASGGTPMSIPITYLAYKNNSYSGSNYTYTDIKSPSGKKYNLNSRNLASSLLNGSSSYNILQGESKTVDGWTFIDLQAIEKGKWTLLLVQTYAGEWRYYNSNTGNEETTVKVSNIALSSSSLSMEVGNTTTLSASVSPSDATDKSLTWTSSNPSVATVSASGVVTAVAAGTATITATANDGSGTSATCAVTVKQEEAGIKVTQIYISTYKFVYVGEKLKLESKVYPIDATDQSLTWTSSNPDVATVSSLDYYGLSHGVVTGVAAGTATITATANDGSGVYATCKVTVEIKTVSSIALSSSSLSMEVGNTRTLSTSVQPYDATDKSVRWTSNNTSVATVNESGVVTAVAAGTATITATANDGSGVSATCMVRVVNPFCTATIVDGKFTEDTPWYLISYDYQNETWYLINSSNDVKGTAETEYPKGKDSYLWTFVGNTEDGYTMYNKGTGVAKYVVTQYMGGSLLLRMSTGTAEKISIINQSDNIYNVQCIDGHDFTYTKYGDMIRSNNEGSTTYTFTKTTPNIKACDVVDENGEVVENTDIVLYIGESKKTKFTWSPSDAKIVEESFTSSNPSVVSVTKDGTLKALSAGTARITCKLTDFKKDWIGYYNVTVEDPATLAEGVIYVGGIYYKVSGESATVTNRKSGDPKNYGKRNEYSGTVNIPESITYNGQRYTVNKIGEYAFFNMFGLQAVVIPATVQTIEFRAFEKSDMLARVMFMNANNSVLVNVGERAFYECSKLNGVTLPNSVISIDKYAFQYCTSLSNITLSSKLNMIDEYAFANCTALRNITLPESLSTIQNYAFADDSALESITFPGELLGVGQYCFENCSSLKNVTFNTTNNSMTIGSNAFKGCSALEKVNVKNLDCYAHINFNDELAQPTSLAHHLYQDGNELQDVVLPETTMYINNYTFSGCSSIQSVTIPAYVQYVNDNIFLNCSSLTKVNCNAPVVPVFLGVKDVEMMRPVFNKATLYVPAGTEYDYKASDFWKEFTIKTGTGTEESCAKPVIAFVGGKIKLNCSTPNAVCHYSYTITPTSGDGTGDVSITPEIVITAYATASGYSQSASVTETFPLNGSGDVNGDGKVTMADANAIVNMVLGK